MSNQTDALRRDDYAELSKDSYKDRMHDYRSKQPVTINGIKYAILDTISTPTGFQATAYRRLSNDEVSIAYRGTEAAKLKFWDQPPKDLGADYEMVRDQTNKQIPDANAFTQRVLAQVKEIHPDWNLSEHVHVTGHSLGGTLAEIMAARYGLGGAGFNAYGAVALEYDIPEGQPANAPAFIGYARATDVVSAASQHYGSMHVYATPEDIENLRAGRYLDAPNPAHPANPLLSASLSAHFVNNFAPDPGHGESVITAANEARYRQYQHAVDNYRQDVMTARVDLHDVLQYNQQAAQKERLEAKVTDALSVASYRMAVHQAATLTGVRAGQRTLDAFAEGVHASGQSVQTISAGVADGTRAAGEAVQHHATGISRSANALDQAIQQIVDTEQRVAAPPAMPMGGNAWLDAGDVGYLTRAAAQGVSGAAQDVGEVVHGVTEGVSHGVRATGETTHAALEDAARRAHAAESRIEEAVQTAASVQVHDRLHDALKRGAHSLPMESSNPPPTQSLPEPVAPAAHQNAEPNQDALAVMQAQLREMQRQMEALMQQREQEREKEQAYRRSESDERAPGAAPSSHERYGESVAPAHKTVRLGYSDPRHPVHPLYADLKERLETQGHHLPEDRLTQIVGNMHKLRFQPNWEGHAVVRNDTLYVADFSPWGFKTHVNLKEPAPPVQETLQQVEAYQQRRQQEQALWEQQAQSRGHGHVRSL